MVLRNLTFVGGNNILFLLALVLFLIFFVRGLPSERHGANLAGSLKIGIMIMSF